MITRPFLDLNVGKRGSTCSGEEETVEETTSEVAKTEIHSENAGQSTASSACQQSSTAAVEVALPTIVHGEPLTDRKSTFQAHVAAVTCVAEVGNLCTCFETPLTLIIINPHLRLRLCCQS